MFVSFFRRCSSTTRCFLTVGVVVNAGLGDSVQVRRREREGTVRVVSKCSRMRAVHSAARPDRVSGATARHGRQQRAYSGSVAVDAAGRAGRRPSSACPAAGDRAGGCVACDVSERMSSIELMDFGRRERTVTHNPNVLDPAVLRPGRLDLHIELALPDREARLKILRYKHRTWLGRDVSISCSSHHRIADRSCRACRPLRIWCPTAPLRWPTPRRACPVPIWSLSASRRPWPRCVTTFTHRRYQLLSSRVLGQRCER
jgi:hypothetical protein